MNKLLTASKPILVTFSLLIGFIGGVIFAVYQAPNFNSQGQQGSQEPDWQQHIEHLEESIIDEPNNTKILSQLAGVYYEVEDYSKSIDAYLKLTTLVDNKSEIFQDLGVVYRTDGQFEKAIESFEKAIALDSGNLRALFNIGVVQYHDLDDQAGAQATWGKVAKLNPGFQTATDQTILQLLEQLN